MPRTGRESTVLTIRVTPALSRRLAREARRQRLTRSEAARAILETALEGGPADDLEAEARRQSELASRSAAEAESLEFIRQDRQRASCGNQQGRWQVQRR